ncbi:monovalent cation/H+ antiporter complex subunit F [Streptomyces sp. RB6PN25]|uniref:Monovalent cation/H+ antiporter complex subunit F n=1 Tax=Streptomyces humicola TaxID=2953240 RepID=A0ABT1Q2F1_9ACTN|nr:monovalent cation/H+ antiporter complex subunit F [Streptomyces humicola]MCQ4084102.1 monovalent cation/H+ antiporter complex subunit F [Streptomyces humicola]
MNAWLLATAVLLTLGLPPCLWAASRGPAHERLAGLNLATTVATVLFLVTAQGFGRSSYADLALVLAVLGPAGTLVFARFLGGRSMDAADTEPHTEA